MFGAPLHSLNLHNKMLTIQVEGGMCPSLPLVLLTLVDSLDRAGSHPLSHASSDKCLTLFH